MKKITLLFLFVLATTFGFAQNLFTDGTFDDPLAWTVIQQNANNNATATIAGGVATFDDVAPAGWGAEGHVAIYKAFTVATTGWYEFDADVTTNGVNEHWFEVHVGTAVPVDGVEYNATKILTLHSWDCGAFTTYSGSLLATGCQGLDGQIELDAGTTYYYLVRTGGITWGTGVILDNITMVALAGPTCTDGIMNGDETGVDCGGPDCDPCPPNVINVDVTHAAWAGYGNWFELPANGGGWVGGSGWAIPELKTVFDGGANTITLKPNFSLWEENPADDFWTTGGVGTSVANKIFEANTFIEDVSLADNDLTFYGLVNSVDFPAGYTVTAFIKGLDPGNGYSDVVGESVSLLGGGQFSVSATAAQLSSTTTSGIIVQYGFQVVGPIADPVSETARAINGLQVTEGTLGTNDFEVSDFNVYPNPSNNVWNIKGQQTIDNIQVFDVLGKQVMTVKPNNTDVELNASVLPKGLYFAKITTDLGSNSIKLIKN